MFNIRAIIAITILSGIFSILSAQPLWYLNLEKDNAIVGYGVNKEIQEARLDARGEVSQIIQAAVYVESNGYQSDTVSKFNTKIKITSDTIVNGSIIIKEEYSNNLWYVAVEYSTIPTVYNLASRIIDLNNTDNKYFNNTNFGKRLNALTGFDTSMELFRRNNQWYISVEDTIEKLDDGEIQDLFLNSSNLNIVSNKNIYNSRDVLSFKIESDFKYRSILCVDSNGKVGLIEANMEDSIYPRKDDGFKLHVINSANKTISEMYVAVFSNKVLDLRYFEEVEEVLEIPIAYQLDDSNYKFQALISLLNDNTFSSTIIKIKGIK